MNRFLSLTLYTLIALLCSDGLQAQSYRWVTGGGSSCSMSPSRNWEKITNICTDQNRNIYAIAVSGGQDITVDTFYKAISHYGGVSCGAPSALILSYNCNGKLRWVKLFDTYGDAVCNDIKYDNAGNLYLVGYSFPGTTKYFTDTAVSNPNYSIYIMKYDTSGTLKWMRFLGANSPANQYFPGGISQLAIDPQGNPHFFPLCRTGLQLTPSITAVGGTYDLKYSPSGNLLSVTRLQVDSNWYMKKAVIAPSGRLYASFMYDLLTGWFNNGITAFSPTGNVVWQDTIGRYCGITDFVYDGANNAIYLAGGGNSGGAVSHLGNLPVSNTTYGRAYSFLGKIDTNGNAKWLTHWDCNLDDNNFRSVSPLPNGRLALAGLFVGTLRKGADSIVTPSNEGQNPFILITDTSGNTIKLDQLHGSGFYDWATAGATDNVGNFYIGGQVEMNITASGLGTGFSSTGGNTDFFLMKYGYPCSCAVPTAHFSAGTPSGKTVQYTYNGTTSGIDSLVWSFDDGQSQTVKSGFTSPVAHTFAFNGSFNVCVTAYGQCGVNTFCQQTALSVKGMAALEGVKVYPNPAADVLAIEGAAGAHFSIANSLGQILLEGRIHSGNAQVDVSALPAGLYLLRLTDANGNRGVMQLMKR